MRVALELTAIHRGAPAGQACVADLPPWGDGAGSLGPLAGDRGPFAVPIVSARPRGFLTAHGISAIAHVAVGAVLVLVPLFAPAPPAGRDSIRVLIYDPPPAPPLPLPKGSPLVPEDAGAPEGMEGGVEGGMLGGIPGGVLGGVVGGTGQGVVLEYDRAPSLIF